MCIVRRYTLSTYAGLHLDSDLQQNWLFLQFNEFEVAKWPFLDEQKICFTGNDLGISISKFFLKKIFYSMPNFNQIGLLISVDTSRPKHLWVLNKQTFNRTLLFWIAYSSKFYSTSLLKGYGERSLSKNYTSRHSCFC